jgi:hypothetical protein
MGAKFSAFCTVLGYFRTQIRCLIWFSGYWSATSYGKFLSTVGTDAFNTSATLNIALSFEIEGQPLNVVNDVVCTRM